MSSYTGITIGPIVDTLMLAHSPAAMWYASYMFSSLTEKICETIGKPENIISPYFDGAKSEEKDGIGRYHDRIIIKDIDTETVRKAIDAGREFVAKTVADDINKGNNKDIKQFVKDYLQVHWVRIEDAADGENPILILGKKLDALELMRSPNPDNTNNPFLELFRGKNFRNEYVKKRIEAIAENSQLKKTAHSLKDISFIASPKDEKQKEMKRETYYALVEADGDRMSKHIESLRDNEALKNFSKQCLKWSKEASDIIGQYGGMTVYAGGDDLLFIAPVYSDAGDLKMENVSYENNDKENEKEREKPVTNIYELCYVLSKKFKDRFNSAAAPSLSFGVSIRYEKFPLYESLSAALDALGNAKKMCQNAMFIDLAKGSGQSIKMLVPFDNFKCFEKIAALYRGDGKDDADRALKSAIYAIEESKNLFKIAVCNKDIIDNVINNTFDNEGQKKYEAFLESYREAFKFFAEEENSGKMTVTKTGDKNDESAEYKKIRTFESVLRLSKFFVEKSGEKR